VLQVVVEQVATLEQAPQGQVLAMDDIIDSSEDEAPPPPLLAQEVEIPNFPNLQSIVAFQVKEVHIEDLVAFDDLNNEVGGDDAVAGGQEGANAENFEHLQVALVETFTPPVDPSLLQQASSISGPSPMAIR